ncbi:MAG: carboxypeptidase-like regulatory domain-containing protein [Alistipes sp.]|nr:carboxypeptidase-like regulatory domain-containing protein [Alistipes sp.]
MKGLLLRIIFLLGLMAPMGEVLASEGATRTVIGYVRDAATGEVLENVHVAVVGTNIGTVSNADGRFVLKLTDETVRYGLHFAHLGYHNNQVTAREVLQGGELQVKLLPSAVSVREVSVYGGDARRLVEMAIERIASNYPAVGHRFTAFYRETVQKRRRYINVAEAVMEVYKSDYAVRLPYRDRARIERGRRLVSQRKRDTLAIKVAGGPAMPVFLDLVKNPDELLGTGELYNYNFRMEQPVMLDNRMQHVIAFEPRREQPYALYIGTLYIDQESLAITRADYRLDVSDQEKATERVLQKRPAGLLFRPQEISFLVTYKRQGSRYYLNYLRHTIRFRCDWKRRSYAAAYTTVSEMVMVDRQEQSAEVIRMRDSYPARAIFTDVVDDYWEEDFWRDYNIIEPTESLETAVERLRKQ